MVKKWLQNLVDIAPEQINEDQMRLPLSLFAARYHFINKEEESAHTLAHNTLIMAVELLSDDDPGNDITAYQKILYAVVLFGDKKDTQTALAMMKHEDPDFFEMECSCKCGHVWTTPGDMWWCMDCISVVLTKSCMDTVKDPNMVNSVCHQDHELFLIPKWDEEKMKVPKGHVPYKGKKITMEQWVDKITDKYHLAKSRKIHDMLH